ncbi:hypothetical protein SBV1_60032 [Verrucomicrobia bacterium]|nr:hypothetical protein SBV1_60032 [Verrucomicrobiota bacterium]
MKNDQCPVPSEFPTEVHGPNACAKAKVGAMNRANCNARWRGFSLSPGERAGVRASVPLTFLPADAAPAVTLAQIFNQQVPSNLEISPNGHAARSWLSSNDQ